MAFRRNFSGGGSNPPVRVGDELDVTIEAVGEKGDGIAKKDGFVLFIPNAKEGETMKVRVTKVLRKVGFAEKIGDAEAAPEAPAEAPAEEATEAPAEEPAPEDSEDFGEEAPAEEETPEAPAEEETPAEEEPKEEETPTEEETPAEEPAPEAPAEEEGEEKKEKDVEEELGVPAPDKE